MGVFTNLHRMALEKKMSEKCYVLQYRQRRFATSARSHKCLKIDIVFFLPVPLGSRFAEVLSHFGSLLRGPLRGGGLTASSFTICLRGCGPAAEGGRNGEQCSWPSARQQTKAWQQPKPLQQRAGTYDTDWHINCGLAHTYTHTYIPTYLPARRPTYLHAYLHV